MVLPQIGSKGQMSKFGHYKLCTEDNPNYLHGEKNVQTPKTKHSEAKIYTSLVRGKNILTRFRLISCI